MVHYTFNPILGLPSQFENFRWKYVTFKTDNSDSDPSSSHLLLSWLLQNFKTIGILSPMVAKTFSITF